MHTKVKIKPTWSIGLVVWLIYNAIIFGTWATVGADYGDLVSRDVILKRLVLPEVQGAVFMVAVVTWLGWWRPVWREDVRGHPHWSMWILLPFIAAFVVVLLGTTDWPTISATHLALLLLASALVGFNEEALTRGVLIVATRVSTRHEVWVWLYSTALFGLMHVPNGFFGIGLSASLTQAVFTFLLGSGLYLLRRVSGTILLPIIVHALWDFSSFSHQVTSEGVFLLATLFQFLAYLVALVLVIFVLLKDRKPQTPSNEANNP